MKLLKTILVATALSGMMVSGAYADRGDRGWDHDHRYSDRPGYDRGWSERRWERDWNRDWDRDRDDYRWHHRHHHERYARRWMPPPPVTFWYWDGYRGDYRYDRW